MVPENARGDNAPSDKAWTIHAAIIGVNMGNMLFRGLELDPADPDMGTVIGLAILAAALPFQAVFFLINSYIQEFENADDVEFVILLKLSIICQVVSYLSLLGLAWLFFNTHQYIGIAFATGAVIAIVLVRSATNQAVTLRESAM
jgi:hypothetical protein